MKNLISSFLLNLILNIELSSGECRQENQNAKPIER
jgi:hypothetical protein